MTRKSKRELASTVDDLESANTDVREWIDQYLTNVDAWDVHFTGEYDPTDQDVPIMEDGNGAVCYAPLQDVPEWATADLPVRA